MKPASQLIKHRIRASYPSKNRQLSRNLLCIFIVFLLPFSAMALSADKPDFSSMRDVKAKKQAFFDYIYVFAEIENRRITGLRKQLQSGLPEQQWRSICEQYLKDCTQGKQALNATLLKHVNIIPPSLVLAQAADESAWGTSRFATQGNNYFGQWCFSKGCGLVPRSRSAGASHEVRRFNSAAESVAAYIKNLNTNKSYKLLRNIRQQQLEKGENISGVKLADGLIHYSQRKGEYVKALKGIIRYNKLVERYDQKFWQAVNAAE